MSEMPPPSEELDLHEAMAMCSTSDSRRQHSRGASPPFSGSSRAASSRASPSRSRTSPPRTLHVSASTSSSASSFESSRPSSSLPVSGQSSEDPSEAFPPSPFKLEAVHTSDRIGNYVLGKTLGEGAFAKVKLGTHSITGLQVAIKIISKADIKEKYVRQNLYREAEIMRKLNHPHIIKLYEIIETKRAFCLVTELASGGEVLDYIVAHGSLPEKEVRKYIRQLIAAVDHLHHEGVVHRDLKAENLLLDQSLNLKIIDFGLSNSMLGKDVLTTQCGSPAYTAPELLGGKQYSKEVDIWSIGVNMYAMLTGRLPFASNNVTTLHALILDQKYVVPDTWSDGCRDLMSRLLIVKPSARITLDELRHHPWVVEEDAPLEADQGPCFPRRDELDETVLSHLGSLGYDVDAVARSVEDNQADSLSALYYLMNAKLKRSGVRSGRATARKMQRVQSENNMKGRLLQPLEGMPSKTSSVPASPCPSVDSFGQSPSARLPRPSQKSIIRLNPVEEQRASDSFAAPPIDPLLDSSRTGRRSRRPSLTEEASGEILSTGLPHAPPPQRRASMGHLKRTPSAPKNLVDLARDRVRTGKGAAAPAAAPALPTAPVTEESARDAPALHQQLHHHHQHHAQQQQQQQQQHPHPMFRRRATFSSLERALPTGFDRSTLTSPTSSTTEHIVGGPLSSDVAAFSSQRPYSRANSIAGAGGGGTLRSTLRPITGAGPASASQSSSSGQATLLPHIEPLPPLKVLGYSGSAVPATGAGGFYLGEPPRTPSRSARSPDEDIDRIRTVRFPMNKRMVSQKSPQEILGELTLALDCCSVSWKAQESSYCLEGFVRDVTFEAEIVRLPGLSIHGVHFRRLKGDALVYTELCTQFIDTMKL